MKSETSSFRLEKDAFTKFKKTAKKKNLSVNSLLNVVMKEYVEWHSFAKDMEVVPHSTSVMTTLLKHFSDEQIKKIAIDYAKNDIRDHLLLVKNEETVDAFLDLLMMWCEVCGYAYSIKETDFVKNITIRHNQTQKYSVLVSETIKAFIEELSGEKLTIKHTTKTVSFSI